jgi:D-serine deaminase-like pyridoxal phosphate-dependent protein
MTSDTWFEINNIEHIDSPALVIYEDRVEENIKRLTQSIDDIQRLRPHIKTHKSPEVTKRFIKAGISKFKCATIAEAEMLALAGAEDVLLAYQPVGPKTSRFLELVKKFPDTKFSCLVDNIEVATHIARIFSAADKIATLYIDLNVGMNRTGIVPQDALSLVAHCVQQKDIVLKGLHAYDGHLRDPDLAVRTKQCDEAFAPVKKLHEQVSQQYNLSLQIVAGGTPTYSIHKLRKDVECSPGTFIYWDKGYETILPEQHYLHAALVISRVISKPTEGVICIDLGHKAIAAENPLNNRVFFLNAPDLQPTGQSEEHLVLKTDQWKKYAIGDVLYGVPYHICPTVALHDEAVIIRDHQIIARWPNESRKRKLTI